MAHIVEELNGNRFIDLMRAAAAKIVGGTAAIIATCTSEVITAHNAQFPNK